MTRLSGKSALVTGGASGIGRGIAQRLCNEGAAVIVADIDPAAGEALAEDLGGESRFFQLDVGSAEQWERCVESIRANPGGLDILVNNAGILLPADITHTSLEDWELTLRVNATGCFLGCQHGVALMRESGGSIINISSTAAMVGLAPYAAYSASKGAVRSLTKSVAAMCRDEGLKLRCNSVHPGAIDTPMTQALFKAAGQTVEEAVSPGMGRPEDVAALVAFLASDESALINGCEMLADGSVCAG